MLVAMAHVFRWVADRIPLLALGLLSCMGTGRDERVACWEYRLVPISEVNGGIDPMGGLPDVPASTDVSAGLSEAEEAAKQWSQFGERLKLLEEKNKEANAALLNGLNDLGADGWEAVQVIDRHVLLKRRV
jgi:hypothetical protein